MAKRQDTAIKAPGGAKKSINMSDEKGNSVSVKAISNGFLITKSKSTKKGWSTTETYSKTKPKINF